jgi:hypothetical protein
VAKRLGISQDHPAITPCRVTTQISTLPVNWADVILLDSRPASHDAFETCHRLKQLAAPRRVALYEPASVATPPTAD